MGRLTTHVLDTATGRPAADMQIELWRMDQQSPACLRRVITNDDGRIDGPILEGAQFTVGQYELRFHAGDYLRAREAPISDPPFLDIVPIRFGIADARQHMHVPLLISPYGYSTYRGS
jgi:5-hydroxyisourate hydrolase